MLKGLSLDEGYWPPKQAQWFINGHKEEGRRPAQLGQPADVAQQQWVRVYAAYEETCRRSGVVDFAEFLLRTYELLRDNETLRSHYQNRFQHVLVDEFQDTNRIQYQWLELFAAAHKNLFHRRRRRPVDLRLARRARGETFSSSKTTTRARALCAWSRTTARPAIS